MKNLLLLTLFVIFTNHLKANDNINISTIDTTNINNSLNNNPVNAFSFGTSYVGDLVGNLSGGIKTGASYLGLANMSIGIDISKLGLWKGGEVFINGAAAHGNSPTENLIGDFQVASNIDAGGDIIYLQEFWFKQSFKKLEFTLGIQDLNAEYANSQNSSEFINSSFGIAPVIADNVPCSIFPITGLGISGKLEVNKNIKIQMALFDGFPTGLNNTTCWNIKDNNGLLYFTELQLTSEISNLTGTYKIGYYYHSGIAEQDEEAIESLNVFNNNYGYYLTADQILWRQKNRSLGIFTQLAFSPAEISLHNKYLGFGVNFSGLFKKQGNDEFGLAMAYAGFNNDLNHKHESLIEIYYYLPINENIYIKPDLQYILNPLGTEMALENALVLFLRFGIDF